MAVREGKIGGLTPAPRLLPMPEGRGIRQEKGMVRTMLWRTHYLAGAAAGLLITGHADIKTAVITAGVAGISALLVDLDDPHSKLGRLVAPASWVVKVTVGHRGPLHSLAGAGVVLLLASMFLKSGHAHLVPMVVAGYLSHLVMDSLNPQGVPWLWPMKTRFGLPMVQTGSLLERLAVTPAMVLLVAWLAVTRATG